MSFITAKIIEYAEYTAYMGYIGGFLITVFMLLMLQNSVIVGSYSGFIAELMASTPGVRILNDLYI